MIAAAATIVLEKRDQPLEPALPFGMQGSKGCDEIGDVALALRIDGDEAHPNP
jgi:hypothetical protein